MRVELGWDELRDVIRIAPFAASHDRRLGLVCAQEAAELLQWIATDNSSLATIFRGRIVEAGPAFAVPVRDLHVAWAMLEGRGTDVLTIAADGRRGTLTFPGISMGFVSRTQEILSTYEPRTPLSQHREG